MEPIPNLMDGEAVFRAQKHELFTIPGTDLSVSVAMVSPNERYPDVSRSFMVYIRRPGKDGRMEYPNVGFVKLELDKGQVDWSCDGLKIEVQSKPR